MTSCIAHVITSVRMKLATCKILCHPSTSVANKKPMCAILTATLGTKKKRPAKPRCKSAKRSGSNTLEQATSGQSNFGDLVAAVLQEVDTQLYIHTFPCRAEFKLTDLTSESFSYSTTHLPAR